MFRQEESKSDTNEENEIDVSKLLGTIHELVEATDKSLEFCKNHESDLPPPLDLNGPKTEDPNDPALTQFKDLLAWDVAVSDPDPGQEVALRKYIPVDLLQV